MKTSRRLKAVLLSVGTELTTGQIVNSNAAWISRKLKEFGIAAELHLVVPDERHQILSALKNCLDADLLFVTGGLGPTSDDFTRDIIAEFLNRKLVYHKQSWQHIQRVFKRRGLKCTNMQKGQCYFPQGAKVLKNPIGTANAFVVKGTPLYKNSSQIKTKPKVTPKMHIFVLPGPPSEIEAIWKSCVDSILVKITKYLDPTITKSWETLGAPEAEVAAITESIFVKAKASQLEFELGYRAHAPYVEVKVSFLQSQRKKMLSYLERLDKKIESITVLKDGEDAARLFAERTSRYGSIIIIDLVTKGRILKRILSVLNEGTKDQNLIYSTIEIKNFKLQKKSTLRFTIKSRGHGEYSVDTHSLNIKKTEYIMSLPQKYFNEDRKNKYLTEKALLMWIKMLE